jgi:hypothetical protein
LQDIYDVWFVNPPGGGPKINCGDGGCHDGSNPPNLPDSDMPNAGTVHTAIKTFLENPNSCFNKSDVSDCSNAANDCPNSAMEGAVERYCDVDGKRWSTGQPPNNAAEN